MRTHRLASAGCGEEAKCPLCGTVADTYEHLHECSALNETKREIEADTKVSAGAWEHATLFFRKRIDGAIFALVLAILLLHGQSEAIERAKAEGKEAEN